MITNEQKNNAIDILNEIKILVMSSAVNEKNKDFFSSVGGATAGGATGGSTTAPSTGASGSAAGPSNMSSWYKTNKIETVGEIRTLFSKLIQCIGNNI